MQRVSENYRKLRNTLRFLLSNLYDFTPAQNSIAFATMQPIDQYILARTAELDAAIRTAYDEFEFHRAYQTLNEFINTDLSALYLDVVKDRLYTLAPHSAQRRSAQTALWRIAEALTRLIAPILSFTADEVWQYLPAVANREPSVHLALFPDVADIVPGRVAGLEDDWAHLLRIRELVNIELEALRASKSIGKGLDAAVTLIVTEGSDENLFLRRYEDALPEFFNVSQVTVQSIAATKDSAALLIKASVAAGSKCERCWRVLPDVGSDARWPSVCARCAEALDAINFPPSNQEPA
jgi:isoleucyl-tRNA synthetase